MTELLGPPTGSAVLLDHRPQILSWDRGGAWSQQRLIPYEAEIRERFGIFAGQPGLSFDLMCGLGPTSNLEGAGDLDNFLVPVAHALGWSGVVSAWGGKNGGSTSTLLVGEPVPIDLAPADRWSHARVRTSRSGGTEAWKQEVAAQLADVEPLPPTGMAEMAIAITVSPGRNWGNVWKPAVDATGRILGAASSTRTWHPRDGRITRLGLSRAVDASLGWDIILDYWWRPA